MAAGFRSVVARGLAAVGLVASAVLASGSATAPAWSATGAAQPAAATSSAPLPRVDIYGDSVTWESEFYMVLALNHRANVVMHVYPGAQICQWFDDMRTTAAAHPSVVLITEGLWGSRDCDHTTNLVKEAQDDASTAAAIFSQSRVVFSADPVVLNNTQFVSTMGYKAYPKLLAAFRAAAKLHKNASFNNASQALDAKNAFVWTKPCLSTETASMGCRNGVITIRQPDGIHLCPITPPQPGHCPEYASGELRWAVAVTAPAVKALPLHS